VSYQLGQAVRVADRNHAGHHRTPGYVKGKIGRIERLHAAFRNPETRAYGEDGLPEVPLYLVSFDRAHVWPGHGGAPAGRIYVDLYEHWLEELQ
jgi:nitrile hydratase subunit beta